MDPVPTSTEIKAAIQMLKDGRDIDFRSIVILVDAGRSGHHSWVPRPLLEAMDVADTIEDELTNGGLDQVVWNHGIEQTHRYARALRRVGVIENADLLLRLATELEAYREAQGAPPYDDPTGAFLAYRQQVRGPFFPAPFLLPELFEAIVEYAVSKAEEFPASL